jgi:hypothetical protein
MLTSSCIIYYPIGSLWSSYGLIKYKYVFIKKIKNPDVGNNSKIITEDDYVFV